MNMFMMFMYVPLISTQAQTATFVNFPACLPHVATVDHPRPSKKEMLMQRHRVVIGLFILQKHDVVVVAQAILILCSSSQLWFMMRRLLASK